MEPDQFQTLIPEEDKHVWYFELILEHIFYFIFSHAFPSNKAHFLWEFVVFVTIWKSGSVSCPKSASVWCLGLGTFHIWTGTWNLVPVPNGTFFRYFTLCVLTKTFISVKK